MKNTISITVYIIAFILFYLLLSLVGTIWIDYNEVIKIEGWFMTYCFLIGWWIAIIPATEVYDLIEKRG